MILIGAFWLFLFPQSVTVVPVIGYLGEVDVDSLAYNPDEVSITGKVTITKHKLMGCYSYENNP